MRYAYEAAAITKEYYPQLIKQQLDTIDTYVEVAARRG